MNNTIELSDKEENDLFKIITNKDEDGYGQDELILDYGYINELLTDRYNKGKEEGIEHEQDRIYSEISNTSIKDIRGDFVDIIDIVDKRILKSIIYNLTPNQ